MLSRFVGATLMITEFRMWWLDLFDSLYIYTIGTAGHYSAAAGFHTFQFTVAHALRFSVSTSRILATDLNTGNNT
jgi:hypothetical protein